MYLRATGYILTSTKYGNNVGWLGGVGALKTMLYGLADMLLLLKCLDNKMVKSPGGFYVGFPSCG